MEYLERLAILLIYQDGTIEFVPKGKAEIHMPYFRELRNLSPRFKSITEGLDFNISIHNHVDTFLASEGIILIYNVFLLGDIDTSKYGINPLFVACLPSDYASEEQKKVFYEIIRPNKDFFFFGRYMKENGCFQEGRIVNDYVFNDELINLSSIEKR